MGKSSAAPPTPDYVGAAKQQGKDNLESARQSNVMSNPNMITPFGNQTVTYSAPTFDETAYNTALSKYNAGSGVNKSDYYTTTGSGFGDGADAGTTVFNQQAYDNALSKRGAAPDRSGFMTGGGQPTVTQTLTPQAQQTLDSQQRVQTALANLGERGIANAYDTLSQPFTPTSTDIKKDFGGYGAVPLSQDFNARSEVPLQYSLDTSNLARMPINAGTTAQDLILQRLNPTIEAGDTSFKQSLANQGLAPGTEAYDAAFRNREMSKNDLYSQAALQGINLDMSARQQGLNEEQTLGTFANQSQLAGAGLYNTAMTDNYGRGMTTQGTQYSQGLNKAQFQNTAQQQQLAQDLALRAQPINEVIGLMGGSQIQLPQFQGYQGTLVAPAPTFAGAQAQGQAANQAYGVQQAGNNSTMQGVSSVAAMAAAYF
mgnify:CR=1 FL=1